MGLSANHDPSRNSSHPSGSTPQVLAVGRSTSLSFPFRGFRGPLLAKCSILYIKDRHIIRLEERFSPFLPPRKRPVVIGRFPSRQWGLLRLPFPFPSPFPFPLSPQADDDLPPPPAPPVGPPQGPRSYCSGSGCVPPGFTMRWLRFRPTQQKRSVLRRTPETAPSQRPARDSHDSTVYLSVRWKTLTIPPPPPVPVLGGALGRRRF